MIRYAGRKERAISKSFEVNTSILNPFLPSPRSRIKPIKGSVMAPKSPLSVFIMPIAEAVSIGIFDS